jgi:hypothetical protein
MPCQDVSGSPDHLRVPMLLPPSTFPACHTVTVESPLAFNANQLSVRFKRSSSPHLQDVYRDSMWAIHDSQERYRVKDMH